MPSEAPISITFGREAPITSTQRQTLIAVAQRRAGVYERIVSLLRRRAPTFTTISVASCEEPDLTRITIGLEGAPQIAEAVIEHLRKLEDVRAATWIGAEPSTGADAVVVRELALVRVACASHTRRDLIDIAHLFGAHPVAIEEDALTLELCGDSATIDNLLRLVRPFGVQALTRSGSIALWRQDAADDTTDDTTEDAH